jgi:hypothetical protein
MSLSLSACNSGLPADGPVGSIVARITQVPPEVGCVAIHVAGSRAVNAAFNVTPGQPATLRLGNLPVGNDAFSAAAYGSACNAIAGAQASWATTSPFSAQISPGLITSLMLTLEPSGGATIGIGFGGDGGGPGDGGVPGSDGGSDGGTDGGSDGGVLDMAPWYGDGGYGTDLAPWHGDGGGGNDLASPRRDM